MARFPAVLRSLTGIFRRDEPQVTRRLRAIATVSCTAFKSARLQVASRYIPYSSGLERTRIGVSPGSLAARKYLDSLPEGWAISQVSALELIVGARDKRDLADIDTFLSAYVTVPLQEATGTRAYGLLKAYSEISRPSRLRFTGGRNRNRRIDGL